MDNTDSIEEISKKLDKVLNGFLAQGCKLIDDVYLEMLITHMSGKCGERKEMLFFKENVLGQMTFNSMDGRQYFYFRLYGTEKVGIFNELARKCSYPN